MPSGCPCWLGPSRARPPVSEAESGLDDQLALVLLCCHPALAPESQVALTLRAVAGLSPDEIARAFLMETRALQQRLVRAKRKIALAGIPFRLPLPEQLPARITAALAVAYLVFNEGYAATTGDRLLRIDLAEEGIRLARLLARLVPEDPEALGLLALLQLHHARRHARVDAAGELVPLEEQDRSRWDSAAIADGLGVLERALRLRHPGPYQLQATIAAQHALARRAEDTPWLQIAALYSELLRVQPSPMVELNRAVAVGMAYGSDAGLTLLERLERSGELSGHHLLPATRADLLRRAGQVTAAVDAYRLALSLAANGAERRYLQRRIAELTAARSNGQRVSPPQPTVEAKRMNRTTQAHRAPIPAARAAVFQNCGAMHARSLARRAQPGYTRRPRLTHAMPAHAPNSLPGRSRS